MKPELKYTASTGQMTSLPMVPSPRREWSALGWPDWPALSLLLLLLAACAPMPAPESPLPPARGLATENWVDETLARLTLREKAGQMVAPWLAGDYLAADGAAYDRIHEMVVDQGIGGIVISIGPPLEVAAKLNTIQRLAKVPLLITADMEHGPGQRLNGGVVLPVGMRNGGGTAFPPVMALGAADDERLAYELGRITAREARAVGIGMVFAPVVDLNNNPANPVINTRSYGADPASVARLITGQIRGLQEHGVFAVAKHFPGHGDTGIDTHIDLPLITVDRARADSMELVPFRAAIDARVTGIMSAHISFPALTGDTTPATLSPRILTGLLREELGFSGLVVSDALDMGAIVRRYGPGDVVVRAIEAGADLLLMPPELPISIDAIVTAVEEGRLTEARIDHSVRKLLALKARLGLHEGRTVSLDDLSNHVGIQAHTTIADEVARRSITLVRDRDRLIPGPATAGRRALSITYTGDPDPLAGRAFNQALAPRFRSLRTISIDPATSGARLDSILAEARDADVVFFSTYVRVITGKGSIAMPEPVAALITALDQERPTVVTSFGNPYLLTQFPEVGTYLLAWGPEEVAQRAAASAILGDAPISGRLPISIPPYHPIGHGIDRGGETSVSSDKGALPHELAGLALVEPGIVGMDPAGLATLDRLLDDAVQTRAIPGAALAVGRRGKLVRLRGYGRLDPRPGFDLANDSTIYDLASLSKVIGTTTAVMLLHESGQLELDAPIARYLPEWSGEAVKDRVTVHQLLTHSAGLPAFGPLWKENRGRTAYLHQIATLDLEYQPGTKEVYSDYGMILLGLMIERITGQPLDAFLDERVFQPLGMRETGYNPRAWRSDPAGGMLAGKAAPIDPDLLGSPTTLGRIAPTEIDSIFRNTHIHGEVHDENAYAIGGVAGHAGLFGSARDLASFAQLLLNGGTLGGTRLLRPETVEYFTTRQPGRTSRAIGWDTPSERSSAGDYFSARSFGHTGFTGTSIWIDPERDLFVILLTNRVNPTRANQRHIALRRAVHDAAQQAIIDTPITAR